jgi:hypothetical protein
MMKKVKWLLSLTYPEFPILSFTTASCSPKRTGWAANEYSMSFSPTMGNTQKKKKYNVLLQELEKKTETIFSMSRTAIVIYM